MTSNKLTIVSSLDVKINKKRLERRIIGSAEKAEFWLQEEIENHLKDYSPEIKGIYSFFQSSTYKEKIRIKDIEFYSSFLAKRFKHAEELGLFIATIGAGIEEKANSDDTFSNFIYNCIGSEYAESAANAMHKFIEKEKGYKMSRYSPGYNDWDIKEQKKLFKLVPGEKIGVILQDSCIMTPEKSVSAVIGSIKPKN